MHTPDGKAAPAPGFDPAHPPPTPTAPPQPHASTSGQLAQPEPGAQAAAIVRDAAILAQPGPGASALSPFPSPARILRLTFHVQMAAGPVAHATYAHAPVRIDTRAGTLETHSGRRFALAPGHIDVVADAATRVRTVADIQRPQPSRLTTAVRALARLGSLR